MMSTAVIHVVMLVLTVVMVTTADPVVPYVAPSNGEQLTEFKLKQLEQTLENVLKRDDRLEAEMEKLKAENKKQNAVITRLTESVRNQAPGGAVYIRWGRTVCEGDAVAVYRGFAGGSLFSSSGGASNTLCLSDSPEWGTYFDGFQVAGDIRGVEYQVEIGSSPFSTRNNGGMSLYNHDAPCVLCHTATRQTQVMIPGRKSCPAEWVMEYWGYLVADKVPNPHKHDYLCVDEAPEVVAGGSANLDGALWYPVEAYCGSLPCAPYVAGREVTCVVCSLG